MVSTRSLPAAAAILAAASLLLTACSGSVQGPNAARADATPSPSPTERPELVVTIGDSIMAGLGVDPDDAWPALLATSTGADIVNLGCSGAGFLATGSCGTDFDGLVDDAVALRPQLVIVQSSDNDLGMEQDEITEATKASIERLHAELPHARLVGIATLWHLDWDEPDEIAWSSSALEDAIDAAGGLFVSIGQPLRGHPELLQWDGEHPNEDGQQALRDAIAAALAGAGVDLTDPLR